MNLIRKSIFVGAVALITSCGGVTNVYDYYQTNVIDQHTKGVTQSTSSKLLLRLNEGASKAQFELIAYKSDSAKYLILGSHKMVKSINQNGNSTNYDVTDLITPINEDGVPHKGKLSIFFTHIPADDALAFIDALPALKTQYLALKPGKGQVMYVNYTMANDVVISFPKKSANQQPIDCVVWVGKRKHQLPTGQLTWALNNLRTFN
mgnify:CR=1 FL=1